MAKTPKRPANWYRPLVLYAQLPETWFALGIGARGLANELLRACPGGVVNCCDLAPWQAVAMAVRAHPKKRVPVRKAVAELLAADVLRKDGDTLILVTPEALFFPLGSELDDGPTDKQPTSNRQASDKQPTSNRQARLAKCPESLKQKSALEERRGEEIKEEQKRAIEQPETPPPQATRYRPKPSYRRGLEGHPLASELIAENGKPRRQPELWILTEPEPDQGARTPSPELAQWLKQAWLDACRERGKSPPIPSRWDLEALAEWAQTAAAGPDGAAARGLKLRGSTPVALGTALIGKYLDDGTHWASQQSGHSVADLVKHSARWSGELFPKVPKSIAKSPLKAQECWWAMGRAVAFWQTSEDPLAPKVLDIYRGAMEYLERGTQQNLIDAVKAPEDTNE